ncbi:MAG TPA: class I tRNA ligase family protein, partial [Candidatus Sumerlaeota bacterium]|nr:class I tRNA ligase family protein [Candidatus Sumerlaeota bacterium]
QKNWIGRSEGAEVDFQVKGRGEKIRVYTTRPDTLFGATFMVLAVDHPLVDAIAGAREKEAIAKYREQAAARATDADATQTGAAPSFGGAGVSPAQAQLHKRGGRYLPHWTKEDATYHVVFRLADSLDQNTLDYIQREKANILKTAEQLNRGLSPDETKRLNLLSSDKIEEALNRGYGECILGREKIASIVADALKHFDNDRYDLIAWCVMPNHVHVIVHPLGKNKLADIVHSWKSFSSKKIIAELGDGRSQVWQEEYFDHIVRNEESLGRQITYVIGNPEAAGLKNWKWRGQLSEDDMRGRDARATNAAHDTDVRSPQASVPQSTESIVREKTGVFIGANAINPVNNAEIPIYISDYVLSGYGTGAIMAVPAHDERDFEFAEKFHLPIKCVISPDAAALAEFRLPDPISRDSHDSEAIREEILKGQTCWSGAGVAMNSANAEVSLNGLAVDEAKARITKWLESKNLGKARTTFRLRDWGISRQRYWGPPIPVLYDEDGNIHPVPEDQLPVTLPPIRDFRPKGDGRGPLANVPEWMNVEINGKKYRRETDVMDNFLDSAWYYLRYVSTDEDSRPYDPELIRKWLPLDVYIGGNEHAVLHLLYTRFICMALDHAGALKMGTRPGMRDAAEPFQKFRAHGLLIKEGSKMSKSKGNVVNPDEYVEKWGADTLRLYLMF